MKLNFFIQMGLMAGISVAEQIVHSSKATDAHKAAAEKFINAAQEFIASFLMPPV